MAAGSSREEGCMLGYLASRPEVVVVVCGVGTRGGEVEVLTVCGGDFSG